MRVVLREDLRLVLGAERAPGRLRGRVDVVVGHTPVWARLFNDAVVMFMVRVVLSRPVRHKESSTAGVSPHPDRQGAVPRSSSESTMLQGHSRARSGAGSAVNVTALRTLEFVPITRVNDGREP